MNDAGQVNERRGNTHKKEGYKNAACGNSVNSDKFHASRVQNKARKEVVGEKKNECITWETTGRLSL